MPSSTVFPTYSPNSQSKFPNTYRPPSHSTSTVNTEKTDGVKNHRTPLCSIQAGPYKRSETEGLTLTQRGITIILSASFLEMIFLAGTIVGFAMAPTIAGPILATLFLVVLIPLIYWMSQVPPVLPRPLPSEDAEGGRENTATCTASDSNIDSLTTPLHTITLPNFQSYDFLVDENAEKTNSMIGQLDKQTAKSCPDIKFFSITLPYAQFITTHSNQSFNNDFLQSASLPNLAFQNNSDSSLETQFEAEENDHSLTIPTINITYPLNISSSLKEIMIQSYQAASNANKTIAKAAQIYKDSSAESLKKNYEKMETIYRKSCTAMQNMYTYVLYEKDVDPLGS